MSGPVIDIHIHLAGVGSADSGCFVSPGMERTLVFKILRRWLKLDVSDPKADEFYCDTLAGLLRKSEHVDHGVVFGMDGVYDDSGRLDRDRSHLFVPNEYLFRVCRKHPEMLPGPSINPLRPDALEELQRCDEAGAVLIKWLPPLQHFDPSDRRCDRFYEELGRRGIPLLAHTGCEHTFPDVAHEYGHAERYRRALETGSTIIFAHCGVACPIHRAHHQTEVVLKMMAEFDHLYSDNSALASLLKFRHLKRIPYADFPGRFVHGSDYPIPSLALPFAGTLGLRQAIRLQMNDNPIEVDWTIKSAAGTPAEVFTNASRLLAPRLRKWEAARSGA